MLWSSARCVTAAHCRSVTVLMLQDLASPDAFQRNPSLVWEFYHYRREVMRSKDPNPVCR